MYLPDRCAQIFDISTPSPRKLTPKLANFRKIVIFDKMGVNVTACMGDVCDIRAEGPCRYIVGGSDEGPRRSRAKRDALSSVARE